MWELRPPWSPVVYIVTLVVLLLATKITSEDSVKNLTSQQFNSHLSVFNSTFKKQVNDEKNVSAAIDLLPFIKNNEKIKVNNSSDKLKTSKRHHHRRKKKLQHEKNLQHHQPKKLESIVNTSPKNINNNNDYTKKSHSLIDEIDELDFKNATLIHKNLQRQKKNELVGRTDGVITYRKYKCVPKSGSPTTLLRPTPSFSSHRPSNSRLQAWKQWRGM